MHMITADAARAFIEGNNFARYHTRVIASQKYVIMRLHDKDIAWRARDEQILYLTLAGQKSRTIQDRLTGLLICYMSYMDWHRRPGIIRRQDKFYQVSSGGARHELNPHDRIMVDLNAGELLHTSKTGG